MNSWKRREVSRISTRSQARVGLSLGNAEVFEMVNQVMGQTTPGSDRPWREARAVCFETGRTNFSPAVGSRQQLIASNPSSASTYVIIRGENVEVGWVRLAVPQPTLDRRRPAWRGHPLD